MNNRNLIVIVVGLILIVAVATIGSFLPNKPAQVNETLSHSATVSSTVLQSTRSGDEMQPKATVHSEATVTPATMTATTQSEVAVSPTHTALPTVPPVAKAYLLVTVQGRTYEPIPLYGETEYTIAQKSSGAKNVIAVTEESICMKNSSCENQNCVMQGTVSLDNLSSRILGNMIVCLPNQVTLELYSPEEIVSLFGVQEQSK